MANKKAIIIGMGQDGFFMKELLISKSYDITEVTRDNVKFLIDSIVFINPDEIYNFSGVSNVISAFENLNEIFEVNAGLPQKILETIVKVNKKIKFFQSSSALMFGRSNSSCQNEYTPFNPLYPYGVAKLYAHNMVNEFRNYYNLFACCGIFFPHESERRKEHFFSRKITKAAATKTKVKVGDLSAYRDYGYAKDYVHAAYLMMQSGFPNDYCIGTGNLISLEDFAKKAFDYVGLNYKDYVEVDNKAARKNDTQILCANITKIKHELRWQPTTTTDEMIKIMIHNDRR